MVHGRGIDGRLGRCDGGPDVFAIMGAMEAVAQRNAEVGLMPSDVGVRWYAIPVAAIGAGISAYHYTLEWFPQIDTGACKVGVPCTAVWFRELGFVSIPFLALMGFLLIIAFLSVPLGRRSEDEDELAA